MKKIFTILTVFMFLFVGAGVVFAGVDFEPAGWYIKTKGGNQGQVQYFPNGHPVAQSEWTYCGSTKSSCFEGDNGNGDNGNGVTPPVQGGTGSANFNIDAKAAGFGIDGDLRFDNDVLSGGFAIGGGIAAGQGSGFVETVDIPVIGIIGYKKVWWWNIPIYGIVGYEPLALGTAEGNINVIAGGFAKTEDFDFTQNNLDFQGTQSIAYGIVGVSGDVNVFGLGEAHVFGAGIGGEATLNFSGTVNDNGLTGGISGQKAIGVVGGGAIAVGLGSADFAGSIEMTGWSGSASVNDVSTDGDYTTKTLGTVAGAWTQVESFQDYNSSCLGFSYVDGGYVAEGGVKTFSVQTSPTGFTSASADGGYSGQGSLGSDFYGSTTGYSVTSSSTMDGFNGVVNQASAGMTVQVGTTGPSVE